MSTPETRTSKNDIKIQMDDCYFTLTNMDFDEITDSWAKAFRKEKIWFIYSPGKKYAFNPRSIKYIEEIYE